MRFRFYPKCIDRFASTLPFWCVFELHVVTYVELYAHAANTRAYDIFGHRFHFEAFSNVFDRPH